MGWKKGKIKQAYVMTSRIEVTMLLPCLLQSSLQPSHFSIYYHYFKNIATADKTEENNRRARERTKCIFYPFKKIHMP